MRYGDGCIALLFGASVEAHPLSQAATGVLRRPSRGGQRAWATLHETPRAKHVLDDQHIAFRDYLEASLRARRRNSRAHERISSGSKPCRSPRSIAAAACSKASASLAIAHTPTVKLGDPRHLTVTMPPARLTSKSWSSLMRGAPISVRIPRISVRGVGAFGPTCIAAKRLVQLVSCARADA